MDNSSKTSTNVEGIGDVDGFCKKSLGALMQVVRASNGLPSAGDDHEFYSSFSAFRGFVSFQKNRLMKNIEKLMKSSGLKDNFGAGDFGDVDDYTDKLIDCNDGLLERVSALLDECSKTKQSGQSTSQGESTVASSPTTPLTPKTIVSSWNKKDKNGGSRTFRLMHALNILRPQLKFKDKTDNTNTPFVPKITTKPNALKPLPNSLIEIHQTGTGSDSSIAISNLIQQGRRSTQEQDNSMYVHPYQYELTKWEAMPSQLEKVEPIKYGPFEQDSLIMVEMPHQLQDLISTLRSTTEFAVDLEHHSYRTFQGITCLMQLSTRQQDYIVDLLLLRSEVQILNEVFTDPKIVKVLHGADSDILWLQRDFGIYIVNMFDTGQAARTLKMERFSLSFLEEHYCGTHFDKKYQLADWRVRPLPKEMIRYAQSDTHYLLYVYDMMRNDLLQAANGQSNLLRHVYNNSRDLCLQTYEKPLLTPDSHLVLLQHRKRSSSLQRRLRTPQQLEALRLIYAWRDSMARVEDESTGYVLPNHMLLQIAEILPREAQGILACCNPIPPLLRQNVLAVHQLVNEARTKVITVQNSLHAQAIPDTKVPVPAKPEHDYEDLLKCPHDLSHHNKMSVDAENAQQRRKSSVRSEECSSLLGPFEAKSPSPDVVSVFRQGDMRCAISNDSPNSTAIQAKLNSMKTTAWDPFVLFMPNSDVKKSKRSASEGEQGTSDEPVTLKHVLSGNFVWKMRRLEVSGDQTDEEKAKDDKPKTFGTVVNVPKDAKRGTDEQIQVIRNMMKSNNGKKKKKHSHAMSAPALDLAGITQSQERPKAAEKLKPNLPAEQRHGGDGQSKGKRKRSDKEQKSPFVPHDYSREDYSRFKKKSGFKKRKS